MKSDTQITETEFGVRRIQGLSPGPTLLVMAGVHGDEFEPIVAAQRLGDFLRPEEVRGEVVIIPRANPSACRRGERNGSDGLDLARTFPGRNDGSETEQAAHTVSTSIRAADYLIDLHTGGTRLSLFPLVGYMIHPQKAVLERQRAMARAFNLPTVWGTSPQLEGRSLSVARDANIPAIYVEYLGSIPFCRTALSVLFDGCLNVLALLGMILRTPPINQVRYFAEDNLPDAGHLQVCHPAPKPGLFEPRVELGQLVRAGDVLGWLMNDSHARPDEILTESNGYVVCLRTFARVNTGDGLAVVVEFENEQ